MNKLVQDVSAQAISGAVYSFVYGVDTVTVISFSVYFIYKVVMFVRKNVIFNF